jgi:hypothetical protein
VLHPLVERAFDDLLACWREHERRRALTGVDPVHLAESRIRLEDARARVHRFRLVMYPDPVELESVVASVFCDTLDGIVHLTWSHRDATRSDVFTCPCGDPVTVTSPSRGGSAGGSDTHHPWISRTDLSSASSPH